MPEESRPNPYESTSDAGNLPPKRRAAPSARWLSVPSFMFGGAVLAAVASFIFVGVFMSAGDFTEIIAVGCAFIGMIAGGVMGAVVGIGFARGTHLR